MKKNQSIKKLIDIYGSSIGLATEINVSDVAVHHWLYGNRQPSVSNVLTMYKKTRDYCKKNGLPLREIPKPSEIKPEFDWGLLDK